ncbi:AraC family transcriptional activator FtrA [Naumannella cuiyingiana]|uniref:AraC family transcriptional activator FtrA n=1 Tax=Naumannella cuiyingiana TaxID=1347891 RepID=A0A7Z0D6K9_9ACTN|nr:helix-turn-helix domain-containing protein [Naumannella cuiyingiana]NYI69842.1 AraC family transcriptional activator FtrA [Naumannella cuiyingiana]
MPRNSSHVPRPHRVVMITGDGANPFELSVATEIFGISRPELAVDPYAFTVCAPRPTVRLREGLLTLTGLPGLRTLDRADTVIAPNRPDAGAGFDPVVLAALRRAHRRGARLISFCTGAFTLAAAGLLDGRPAATHWMWAEEFARSFPAVELREDVLYVDDGDVLTAAGSAAALDLCLYLMAKDHGAEVANAVARRLVFSAHRDGGQQQFIDRPLPAEGSAGLTPVLDWARRHLDRPLTVAALARRAGLSPASLHRRFRAELGLTPLAWLNAERVRHARRLLETTDLTANRVAAQCGMGDVSTLRRLLRRACGLSPSEYRRRFAPPRAAAG